MRNDLLECQPYLIHMRLFQWPPNEISEYEIMLERSFRDGTEPLIVINLGIVKFRFERELTRTERPLSLKDRF